MFVDQLSYIIEEWEWGRECIIFSFKDLALGAKGCPFFTE